ncbi:hypothetical protein OH76DRAFT_1420699 [Lentinus brumalis]|uniref:DUF4100 domain-containing protein n=1 Tax=Lentinus brumalis TaxID=2498619 RepID=A0A371CZI6_9APHY|nr:hypothetical protein OH76DRAFT_1420699 [Polyporus brumalis]
MTSSTTHTMPIPGMSDAPKFDGHYLSDFLEDLELHFARAGVTDEDRQVNYITRYSTDKIRKQIGSLPELDRSKTNKTWSEAKAVLKEFYGDVDKPRPLSLAEFQAWVQSCADKPAFVSKDQVNKYYAEFMSKGRPLLDNKQVSENDLNFAFIQGVPSAMKAALRGLIPEANRTRTSPSPIKKTLEYLRGLANKDDPTYESWRYEHIAAEDTLVPALPEDQDASTTSRTIQNTAAGGRPAAKSSAVSDDQMDSLLKQFAELKIMMAQMQPGQQNQQNRPQRCAMCSTLNPNHTMRTCPESLRLVAEGRIQLDAVKNRYVLTSDGSELPRIPYGYEGGIAAYLRAQMPIAPTTHATHSAGLVFENGAILSTLSDVHVSHPALRSGKEYENRYDPKKRPQDKPTARQQTQHAPPPPLAPLRPPVLPPVRPAQPPAPVAQPLPQPAVPALQEPPHPINRKDGWKQSQPKSKGKEVQFHEDVQMKDGTAPPRAKSPAPATGYKHTTELDMQTNAKDLLEKILKEVPITLPLGQILGTSATLQDLFHEVTRRRRVPKDATGAVGKPSSTSAGTTDFEEMSAPSTGPDFGGVFNTASVSVSHLDASGVPIVQAEYTTASPLYEVQYELLTMYRVPRSKLAIRHACLILVHDGAAVSQQQLAFSTFALSRVKNASSIQERMFAMAQGIFTVKVNDIPFRCMVDSGSELNVALRSFPDVTRLPLDTFGEFWKLQGIHGDAETLAGYVDRVPFQIGRHTFEHHVFVSPHQSIGDCFDIILGQPFLTYFDARMEYSATGETVLYLWADRNKDHGRKPTLGISITDPEDVRNKTDIVAKLHAVAVEQAAAAAAAEVSLRLTASVEELDEEDYYEDSEEAHF